MKRIAPLAALLIVTWAFAQVDQAEDGERLQQLQLAIARAEIACREESSAACRVNLPVAQLKLKKARLRTERGYSGAGGSSDDIRLGMRLAEMAEAGEVYQPPRSVLTELAYVAANDGSVQPYYVFVPRDYDASRPWPLVVFLHGYVPSITVLDPWVLSDEVCRIAEANGCLLMLPYGRRNSDFQGAGEVDVFDSIAHMREVLNVDPRRIYLSGVSMGGMGAWTIGLRNPGVFAAIAPISGQTDMFRWWGWNRSAFPPWKQFLVDWDNAINMAPNARGQDFLVQHGEKDTLIPVVESRSMAAAVQALGIPIGYYEFPGASHYIYWETECYENAWTWSKDFTLDPSPKHISFVCYSLNYNRCFWLTVRELQRWGSPATVDAQVTEGGSRLEVGTENVAILEVDTRTCPMPTASHYQVTTGGRSLLLPPLPDGRIIVQVGPRFEPAGDWPPMKRKGLCGPCEDVLNTPFIVVQGTAGDLRQTQEVARQVGTWMQEWDDFADGAARVCTDGELSQTDIDRYNLVLFGTPETNSVLRRIADKLPIRIDDHRYTLGESTWQGSALGLVMCYPNPLKPDRYVLIYSGELYGRKLSANHKYDLLPDFVVFDSTRFTTGDTETAVAGGWFDVDWLPRPELTSEGDETH